MERMGKAGVTTTQTTRFKWGKKHMPAEFALYSASFLTVDIPGSWQYEANKNYRREYHAKNIVIDFYIFFHILDRRRRFNLPGNLAEISEQTSGERQCGHCNHTGYIPGRLIVGVLSVREINHEN